MAYSLEIAEEVRSFLANHPLLGREGKNSLYTHLDICLRHNGDYYRRTALRLAPGSDCFWLDIAMPTTLPDGSLRQFWFVVNDSPATYGVLRVLFVDEATPQSADGGAT